MHGIVRTVALDTMLGGIAVRNYTPVVTGLPPPPLQRQRRVVVTGLGTVDPLACGVGLSFKRLMEGCSGISEMPSEYRANTQCSVMGRVCRGNGEGEFDMEKWVDKEHRGRVAPFVEYALCASTMALDDSGWVGEGKCLSNEQQERMGVTFGCGIGSMQDIRMADSILRKEMGTGEGRVRRSRVSPFFIPKILVNMAAGHISIKHGLKGPTHAPATACAAGAHSIGDAYRLVKYGHADVMVAGGCEGSIDPLAVTGFAQAKALSTASHEAPSHASRPFDSSRDGFVMGEGAAAVILEELDHAQERGAHIYAEIRGYGMSGDAYHITCPPDDGDGAYRAMKAALQEGGLDASDLSYINAHATSTIAGDTAELTAIEKLMEKCELSKKVTVSSTKGATGHLLGAAGAVEAVFTVMSLHSGSIPPCLNLKQQSPPAKAFPHVTLAKNGEYGVPIRAAMSNSFGFGGTNASLLFTSFP